MEKPAPPGIVNQGGPSYEQAPPPYDAVPGQPQQPDYVASGQQQPQVVYMNAPQQQMAYGAGQPQPMFVQAPGQAPAQVVIVQAGGCPQCHNGYMEDRFTCCGICLAILFWPAGLICCFLMREKVCPNCGYTRDAQV